MIRNLRHRLNALLSLVILCGAISGGSVAAQAWTQMAGGGQRGSDTLLASPATDLDSQPIFLPAETFILGSGVDPISIAIADLNADGRPDLIVAGNGLIVRLGNGDGTFESDNRYFYFEHYPWSVLVADVNDDRMPDLVSASGTLVDVLLGKGDGTFFELGTYDSGGNSASSIALADVNNDGKLDVIVANSYWEDPVGILLGNGDGTFQVPVTYRSLGARCVTVADVNRDGKPDLLVANWSSSAADDPNRLVGVLLGNGDGTFQPGTTFLTGGYYALAISSQDVNADLNPDLLVMSQQDPQGNLPGVVGVLLGNGDGTFLPAAVFVPGPTYINALAVSDVNLDGKLDLLVSGGNSDDWVDGTVGVLMGNGDGTFDPPDNYDSGGVGAGRIALADLNGDDRPDLLVGNARVFYEHGYTRGIGVLLNNAGAPPTTTTLVSSVNPADRREVVTYTASVAAQSGGALSGTVLFRDGNRTIATVPLVAHQAAYTTEYRDPGTHPISATFSGDLQNGGSTSPTLTEYIQSGSRTSLVTSGSPSYVGQPVTLTATVIGTYSGAPVTDGTLVSFYDGTILLGSVALQGGVAKLTTSSLSVKNHLIRANYPGNSSFKPSHRAVGQLVQKYPTTTTLTSAPNPSVFGEAVTFTATVIPSGPYPPVGKVKFLDGITWIGSAVLIDGAATFKRSTLAVGTHTITAQYLGDAVSAHSASSALNHVVQ